MCRIAGIIDKNRSAKQLQKDIQSMCDVMAHGGPDGEGFYFDEGNGLALGHRRLAMIDLSENGHQPMQDQSGKIIISFNGEIYNYQELKAELIELGFQFRTHTDTEVILLSYRKWGITAFEKFKGMFAFALYDQQQQKTLLVRDGAGIKPLYYSEEEDCLTFASEVKAFKQSDKNYQEHPNWKVYLLAFGHIPEPYTTLEKVKMLPKRHILFFDHITQRKSIVPFTNSAALPKISGKQGAIELVNRSLTQAVNRHLIADAPIGLFLSGGIDSSALALLAKHPQLNTLSVNFDVEQFSEIKYQTQIAEKTGSLHRSYTIDQSFFEKHFEQASRAMDQPTTDGINSWFISYFAKQNGLKAVLSGIGADELFGGYPSFKRMWLVKLFNRLPQFVLKSGLSSRRNFLKRMYYLSYKNTSGLYLFLRGIYNPLEISELLNLSLKQVNEILSQVNIQNLPEHLNDSETARWIECNMYMQNQLLKDTDFMSMKHGVEVRVPFLDQDLIKTVESINCNILYQNKTPKKFLIDALKGLLPESIWNRPKMGFTFPFQHWLKHNTYFIEGLSQSKNLNKNKVQTAFVHGELHWSKAMALFQANQFELISVDQKANPSTKYA